MEFILSLTYISIGQVWMAWLHNWPYLGMSIVIATLLKLYVDANKVSAFLKRFRRAGVVAATTAAVATPLCSCGTTAVVLGMMASMIPWAPIIAFMVASPLTSPEELVYSAGLFGWPFALAFFLSSIVLGLVGGWVAAVFESRGWLANQTRFVEPLSKRCACSAGEGLSAAPSRVFSLDIPAIEPISWGTTYGCSGAAPAKPAAGCGSGEAVVAKPALSCGCGGAAPARPAPLCGCGQAQPRRDGPEVKSDSGGGTSGQGKGQAAQSQLQVSLKRLLRELYKNGRQLLVMFTGFAFVGYFLNGLIPADWVGTLFGGGNVYNVPLAATLGLPLYINSEASLPLVRSLLDSGMSPGAALAFTISGAGTSIGAIGGALTIARWRVVALVVGVLWAGAILSGLAFNLALKLNLF
jgi:uncharacterized membrane protein YraQ (UPF0718 family)